MHTVPDEPFVVKVGERRSFDVAAEPECLASESWVKRGIPPAAWRGALRDLNGTIYLAGQLMSTDGGRTVCPHNKVALNDLSILHNQRHPSAPGPEGAVLVRPGLFLALDGQVHLQSPGVYTVRTWRSTDDLSTVETGQAVLRVPDGPRRERQEDEWYGLYICRSIVELPGGALLATATGAFHADQISPSTKAGRSETLYLCRTFVIVSHDEGRTWDYVSTLAAPQPDDPVDEGFGEPTMVLLDDGRLLCIMRTGHHRPLYACWSADGGMTWTEPVYTGLERGCWPSLVKLTDGRLALTYGKRFPEGWSRITAEGDHERWTWPGPGLVKLAINRDGTGQSWEETTIGRAMGSCYTTLLEVETNVLFCQVDGWYFRIMLAPKVPASL